MGADGTTDANEERASIFDLKLMEDEEEHPYPPRPPLNPGPTLESRTLPSEKTLIDTPATKRPLHHNEPNWSQLLYSPQAGTSTTGSKLLKKIDKIGLSTPTSTTQLSQYEEYEFESFTFLQEIIPNLYLGRYHPVK
jgi:hypothetical protein